MAKQVLSLRYFNGGISNSKKEGLKGSFRNGKRADIISDANEFSILPTTVKRSGSTVVDLIKWIVPGTPSSTDIYSYGSTGRIYSESSSGTWTDLRTVASSAGQGLEVFNDYLYYTQNSQLGRYGPLSGVPAFTDNWKTGLTATTDFAPIKAFKEGFVVGHGNNIAWYNGVAFQRSPDTTITDSDSVKRLILPPGLKVRSFEILGEFLVIGTWRGTNIYDNNEGYLFFWDGTATTFNFFAPISEGACNALCVRKNALYTIAGSRGYIEKGYQPFQIVQTTPNLERGKFVEVYPGAITNYLGSTCIGIAGSTDSTAVFQGVYVYGSQEDMYPDALNYAYTVSTATERSTSLKIGSLKGIGNFLYIGWQDGVTYGVDRVGITNAPYANASIESLIFDDQRAYASKQGLFIKVQHLPLLTGESVQVGFRVDRDTSFTYSDVHSYSATETKPKSVETRMAIPSDLSSFNEIEITVVISQTNGTSPTVTWMGLLYEDLKQEDNF